MIDGHRDGIAEYCCTQENGPLGFVEAHNDKIRVIQLRAYGRRDEKHLQLKILTCTAKPLQIHRCSLTVLGEEPGTNGSV